jgi:hypothetical protein
MTDRKHLHLARPSDATAKRHYSLVRKAARQFRGSYAPRDERHALILKLVAARLRLGDDWILAKRHAVQKKERA